MTAFVQAQGARFAVYRLEGLSPSTPVELIWAHGWGQTHELLLPLAQVMQRFAPSNLVDFPGFGKSPPPPGDWGTAEYADAAAEWLATLPKADRIWIGHSFGCRVGLQVAARHPGLLKGLFLVAAAGVPRQRSFRENLRFRGRTALYRMLRRVTPEGPKRDALRDRFGSADYRNAGAMRPVFVKVVGENFSAVARSIRCPVALIYGANDRETPPSTGEQFRALIPDAKLFVLEGYDHLSVLSRGRHQVLHRLNRFIKDIAACG